ncbi:transglycosylase SLT domain-containing protein [Amphritea sp.]|uniref:transglycosylase SLT domain-containing protein n=1 Tax=Amphritea sp. TaxID=1872502 RepID=UPI003A911707
MSYKNSNTLRPRLVCSLLLCFFVAGTAVADSSEASRRLYQKSLKQLNNDNLDEYYQLKAQLTQYPLYPYLEQQELTHNFAAVTQHHIDLYAKQYADVPTVYPLEQKWLNYLATHKRWKDYIVAYKGSTVRNELSECHYRNALLQTGQASLAVKGIDTLWNAGHSVSSACDSVFSHWMKQHNAPSSKLAYQRFWKAADNNNMNLAVYLQRYIKDAKQKKAVERFLSVRKDPALITDPTYFPGDTVASRITYLYGIDRLSRKSPQAATQAWFKVRSSRSFNQDEQQKLSRTLARRLANIPDKHTDGLLKRLNTTQDEEIQERRIKLALTDLNWNKVHQLIDEMPAEMQQDERWVYWKTLSASHIKGLQPAYSDAFVKLSTERSYYGLLAARTLQTSFRLNPQQDKVVEKAVLQQASAPAMQRMHELYQLDQRYLARREWNQFTRQYDAEQLRTAATVLHRWGWHNMAIIGVAKAKYWDDIALRFPMPYSDTFATLAGKFNIDTNWARAIARQESAYQPHARSRVGARGLMQLMPKTAKMTAKHNDIPYKQVSELYQPSTNINLGVAYLAEMQKKFNNNQVYATAAYNAGPSRVNRWLKQRGELPIDIWIETIPFTETRRYVMNVMAYHAVYRTLAGKPTHLPEGQTAFRVALQSSTGAHQAEQLRDFIRHNTQ